MTSVMASPLPSGHRRAMTATDATALQPTLTVNELLARIPEASGLLLDLGIDTCCGGGATLAEACQDSGAELSVLMSDLAALARHSS